MTKHTFKVGDRVRRINGNNNSTVKQGTEWTVAGFEGSWGTTCLKLKETSAPAGFASNFELVTPAVKPQLPIPATFEFPRAEVNAVLSEHFGKKLGISLKVLGTSRVGEVCTFDAEVSPA